MRYSVNPSAGLYVDGLRHSHFADEQSGRQGLSLSYPITQLLSLFAT